MELKGSNLIIVNILATYGRILVSAIMILFSTRWVLKALGKEDFGLYSVVGGLIVFILFIGNTLASSVGRFYAYSIGQGDEREIRSWFNIAFILHVGISMLLFAIGLPVGYYLISRVMTIPESRIHACLWVYNLSIIGAVGTMITTPYIAMFYAKQRIFELSFWGILATTFNFFLALYLLRAEGDLLLIYSIGIVIGKLVIDIIQIVRARFIFSACKINYRYFFDKYRYKKLFSFAGWRFWAEMGYVLRNQGVNFLINLYSGPKVNTAYGIANQVSAQTGTITSAITGALDPEITSREGAGDRNGMVSLSLRSCKFVMLLTFLWLIPLYIEMDYVLGLWLGEVPEYAVSFCRIILLVYAIEKTSIGYSAGILAHGEVSGFQMTMGIARLITFPLVWGAYLIGAQVEYALCLMLLSATAVCVTRVLWMKKLMNVPITLWYNEVFNKCLIVLLPSLAIAFFWNKILDTSFLKLIIISIINIFCIISASWLLILTKDEKHFILDKIHKIKNKIFSNI